MTIVKDKPAAAAIKELLSQSPDGLREIVRAVMQEMLEAEVTDALQAEKGQRTATRLGDRSGSDSQNWLEVHRYLNMEDLKEHKKDQLREAA
ncbi:transposase [Microvirga sp. TS319]|uniref:transposase n=1 Tax=Microvirga sp. TS319 TaxID=3241165 RepID=UPI00351A0B77